VALEKAVIIRLESGERIPVMFNPEEYAIEVGNTFAEIGIPGLERSPLQYVRGNARTLQMELFFDTYEVKRDVRAEVARITGLLQKDPGTQAPPILLVTWGSLQFRGVLESASQRFVMFLSDGTPVRARANVTFKEFAPLEVEVQRGLFLGPPSVRTLVENDTLSRLAHEHLGDPGAWREIAELNGIDDPFDLRPGSTLLIPTIRTRTTR
jgi:nucleoid-associated protein YgaU